MKRKNIETFTGQVNAFVEKMQHHVDVLSVKSRGRITTITYEDWTEHPKIINTTRKKLPGELGYYPTVYL